MTIAASWRRVSIHLGLVAALSWPGAVTAQPFSDDVGEALSLVDAVNKAGRQRMLVQRVVKSYLMIGIGAEPERAELQLHDAVALFNTQLAELRGYAKVHPGVAPVLTRIETLWGEFEAIVLAPVSLEGARKLVVAERDGTPTRDDSLLELCDRLAIELEVMSPSPTAYYVNLAGRQRMLTQRIAKFYMMLSSGFDNDLVRSELAQAQLEFEKALEVLEQVAVTEGIQRDLSAASEQWEWLKSALTFERQDLLSGGGVFFPLIIEGTSEKTLLVVDRLTRRIALLDQDQ